MPKGLSQKLLREVRAQQESEEGEGCAKFLICKVLTSSFDLSRKKKDFHSLMAAGESSDGEDNLTDYDEDYDEQELEVDEDDEAALNMFMDTSGGKRKFFLNLCPSYLS